MIQGLQVIPTDRSVLFTWNVTDPISEIPCVVEVHTAPDLETGSYVGELSEIATHYRQDADDADRNYRDGNRRMLVIGHSVRLQAATPYYYRLHCGGDVAVGMFQTLTAAEGRGTQTLIRTGPVTANANPVLEYGTNYSRATGTMSGGGTASATCTEGRGDAGSGGRSTAPSSPTVPKRCVATFSASRGSIVYYRWKDLTADGSALLTGSIQVTTAK